MPKNIETAIGKKITEIFNLISEQEGYLKIINNIDHILSDDDEPRNKSGFEYLRSVANEHIPKDSPLYPHLMQFNLVVNGAIGTRDKESRQFLEKTKIKLTQKLN